MEGKQISIRNLHIEDIPKAMELVLAEGWNQTENDWQLFIKNPLNICRAAEIGGKLVGTTTSINYSNDVAWIGMVLVNKEYREKGISTILLNSVLHELQNFKSIKLDSTPTGQFVYKKFGFFKEYRILNMVNTSFEGLPNTDFESVPRKVQEKDIPAIIEFDKRAFGVNRTHLIQSLVKDYPEKSWMIKRDNKIAGFALGRTGNKCHRIGPVSAQSLKEAQILITYTLKNLSGQPVVIDIPEFKDELIKWLISAGFVKQRHFTRMFQNSNPIPGQESLQYVISGPEFG